MRTLRALLWGMMVFAVLFPIFLGAETIYEVQFNDTDRGSGDDCYPSPFNGSTVTVTGVVTGVTTNTAYDNFWIQGASGHWRGIYVFDNSIHPSPGDSITLTGSLSEYFGMTEIDPSSSQIHTTGRPLPEPVAVTSADLAGGCSATGEAFEGVLVRIENVVVTDVNGAWYVSDDGGVTQCQIEDNCFLYNPFVGQEIASITGLVTYSWSEYEINPRDMDDIVLAGPPSIAGTDHSPESPTSSDAVIITAQVIDSDGVESAWLFFSTDGEGTFDSTAMVDDGSGPDATASDNIYTGQISPQEGGTTVNYYIKAVDEQAMVATDPAGAPGSTYSFVVSVGLEGTGSAWIKPLWADKNSAVDVVITFFGDSLFTITKARVIIPSTWSWSQSEMDVVFGGAGFSGASVVVSGDTITISGASVVPDSSGILSIAGMISPATDVISTFSVQTSTNGGGLSEITYPPKIVVGSVTARIAAVRANPDSFENMGPVTLSGVVTIGTGILDNTRTRAYIQDDSGFGINVFDWSMLEELVRGNLVLVRGNIERYVSSTTGDTTLEITDIYDVAVVNVEQQLPTPRILTTQEVSSEWEGTWIGVSAEVTEVYYAGGGYNITVDDGTGPLVIRIWDSTEIDTDSLEVGETHSFLGVGSTYRLAPQMLVGYQEDIDAPPGDGDRWATALIEPSTVNFSTSGLTLKITIKGVPWETTVAIEITLPLKQGWTWDSPYDVVLGGALSDATYHVSETDPGVISIQGFEMQDLTGTVQLFNLTSPSDPGVYTFWVKTATDIDPVLRYIKSQPTVEILGASKASLRVPSHPFAPVLGEQLEINFIIPKGNQAVLRLFDLEGRMVATLFDGLTEGGKFFWDGRNELRERVPIGVYICHLEATDPITGKTTTSSGPVVVATPLK